MLFKTPLLEVSGLLRVLKRTNVQNNAYVLSRSDSVEHQGNVDVRCVAREVALAAERAIVHGRILYRDIYETETSTMTFPMLGRQCRG